MRPIHVFLFILAGLVLTGAMCLVLPPQLSVGNVDIRIPDLCQVLDLQEPQVEAIEEDCILLQEPACSVDSVVDTTTQVAYQKQQIQEPEVQEPTVQKPQIQEYKAQETPVQEIAETNVATPIPDEDTIDTHVYLAAFYQSLSEASNTAIRVVHYGDSQIEEDRLTTQVRRALQNLYGGGGVGLLPLHQTIPTRTIWQSITMNGSVQSINQGPKRYLVYGPKSFRKTNGTYGPMGQVAIMDNQLKAGSEDIVMQVNGNSKQLQSESYFNRIRVVKKGDIQVSIARSTGKDGDLFILPDSTTSATIHLQGRGEVYGISLENEKGIMVDNIPMRGCSGAVFTSVASNEMQDYFRVTNTRLIIMQYGGNVMPYTTSKQQVEQYVASMQRQVQYIKYLAPESSIVFVGPSDMSERRNGELQTYRMIPVMDKALRQMAIEEEIGYFSMYKAMGGRGSMIQWKQKGLAGGDYVHFTRKGAEKAGKMLAEWLLEK